MISDFAVKISDRELWLMLKSGEDNAYRYLYRNYYPAMCAAAYSYVKESFVSESLVDDVIFHIYETRDRIDIASSLKQYLLISVRNKCMEYMRSAAIARRETIADCENRKYHRNLDDSAEEYVIGKELYELLLKAIDSLPPETKRVFELSRFEGYSYEEIERELGISVNTVKYHMKKALAILRTQFSEYALALLLLLLVSSPPPGMTSGDISGRCPETGSFFR